MGFFSKKEPSVEQMKAYLAELEAKVASYETGAGLSLPPRNPQKREHLFPAMKGELDVEVSKRLLDLKSIGNRLKSEQQLLSQEADSMISGVEEYKNRMNGLKAQLESGAEQLEELWIQINFECEYLNNIINYAKKSRDRRDKLPQEIAQDKQKDKKGSETPPDASSSNTIKK